MSSWRSDLYLIFKSVLPVFSFEKGAGDASHISALENTAAASAAPVVYRHVWSDLKKIFRDL
jgi:hypothetical protein